MVAEEEDESLGALGDVDVGGRNWEAWGVALDDWRAAPEDLGAATREG